MKIFNKTKEKAQVINSFPNWEIGAPMPQVFSNGNKTFLIYIVEEDNPNFESEEIREISQVSDEKYSLALIEFLNPDTHKFGVVSDETINGHPLYSKGLKAYSAHIIENSRWISELKSFRKVHPYFNEDMWLEKRHFLLTFHDEIFEIIANDFNVELHSSTFLDLALKVSKRINSE